MGNDETVEALPAELPNIRNEQASNVAPTSATLGAEIDPMRWNTVYLFEYGTTPAYGDFTELNPKPIGNDHTFHPVSEAIGNLEPGTVYHFRVVAINYTGTQFGPDQTFATPGAAHGRPRHRPAASPTTSAHLVGLVNPNSTATAVHFEYGPTAAYGASTGALRMSAAVAVDREAGADIGGLAPNTTYHYRVVATNAARDGRQPRPDVHDGAGGGPARAGAGEAEAARSREVKRHGKCVKPHRKKHRKSNHRNG